MNREQWGITFLMGIQATVLVILGDKAIELPSWAVTVCVVSNVMISIVLNRMREFSVAGKKFTRRTDPEPLKEKP